MALVINPKVSVIDYGPKVTLPNGQVITSDEIVWGASRLTYKEGTMEELRQAREAEKDISETVRKSLMKSAGSGHASMATTPAMWIMLEGTCSKMVDSAFTGMRFASSLMPSGRRIPIAIDQITIPAEIERKAEAREIYLKTSEANILAYEQLQTKGVPKEEAAKIVQYGHRGGGFMFLPLETLIAIARDVERHPEDFPTEIRDITKQLGDFARDNGMRVTYEARMAAPRTGCVNPNIFHSQVNEAQEALDWNWGTIKHSPLLQELSFKPSVRLEERINAYLAKRAEVTSSPARIIAEGSELVHELQDIVQSYNNSFHAVIAANIPWRVWGEDKRHRTMPLITESIYNAVERAENIVPDAVVENLLLPIDVLSGAISMPEAIRGDTSNLLLWTGRFLDSLETYRSLVDMGIPKGDALGVIPRGIKLGVTETFDLYNATTGHNSLRTCSTAEKEKRQLTEAYRNLLMTSDKLPRYIKELLAPKCNYVGFCFEGPETWAKCRRVNRIVPGYDESMHAQISAARANQMISKM